MTKFYETDEFKAFLKDAIVQAMNEMGEDAKKIDLSNWKYGETLEEHIAHINKIATEENDK